MTSFSFQRNILASENRVEGGEEGDSRLNGGYYKVPGENGHLAWGGGEKQPSGWILEIFRSNNTARQCIL